MNRSLLFSVFIEDFWHRWEMNRSTTLKVLRNFGSAISNVHMVFRKQDWNPVSALESKFLICLERYLAAYCLESLKEITLTWIEPDRTSAFETGIQFRNVEKVVTSTCYFGNDFSFEANFPNVQILELKLARCTFDIKHWHFPTVKHLHFNCYRYESRYSKASAIDLIEMFKRQPQLEKLKLTFLLVEFSPNLAKCFNEFSPRLQCLTLQFVSYIPRDLVSVHLEHITDFKLTLDTLRQGQHIPFTFNRLERVEISLSCGYKTHQDSGTLITEFISKNKHLKSIIVKGLRGDFQQLFEFEHILSNVEELNICGFENVSSAIIERFLAQSRSLKLLRICGIDGNTDILESKISEKIPHTRCDRQLKTVLEFIFRL